jgi:hypothetical protein
VGSAVASAVASGDAIAASEVAVDSTTAEDSALVVPAVPAVPVAPVAPAAAAAMGTAIVASADPLTLPADLEAVATASATTGGTAPEAAVGMAVTAAAHAHMMTDLAVEASATVTSGSRAATWSPSGRAAAARMVGTAAVAGTGTGTGTGTTTGPETTTTRGSAASTVATKIPGSCDATNKTGPSCLVVGITFFILVFLVSLNRLVSAVRVSRLVRGAIRHLEATSASSSQSNCARVLHRQGNLSSFISRRNKVIPTTTATTGITQPGPSSPVLRMLIINCAASSQRPPPLGFPPAMPEILFIASAERVRVTGR